MALLIDGALDIVEPAANADEHLIQMLLVAQPGPATPSAPANS